MRNTHKIFGKKFHTCWYDRLLVISKNIILVVDHMKTNKFVNSIVMKNVVILFVYVTVLMCYYFLWSTNRRCKRLWLADDSCICQSWIFLSYRRSLCCLICFFLPHERKGKVASVSLLLMLFVIFERLQIIIGYFT